MAAENSYASVTEIPSGKASREQLDRLYTRYRFASEYCTGKDVLEAACGAGLGLGYLAKTARSVVGCDIDAGNITTALRTYEGRPIRIDRADVQELPYGDECFDVVVLFEAIYYLGSPEKFISESWRVLKDKGVLIVCSANREWTGFNPSPFNTGYLSATELYKLLYKSGFKVKLMGYCRAGGKSLRGMITGWTKRFAVRFGLMPKTMKGKEIWKRIFMGKLESLPVEVDDGMGEYLDPVQIPLNRPNAEHKVILAIARKLNR